MKATLIAACFVMPSACTDMLPIAAMALPVAQQYNQAQQTPYQPAAVQPPPRQPKPDPQYSMYYAEQSPAPPIPPAPPAPGAPSQSTEASSTVESPVAPAAPAAEPEPRQVTTSATAGEDAPKKLTKKEREAREERRNQRAAELAERKASEQRADDEFCGPEPKAILGEYFDLERAVKRIANDPDSVDFQECSAPERAKQPMCWVVVCDIRAKNGFGALVLTRRTFSKSREGWSIQKR